MHFIEHVTRNKEDWERLKEGMALDPSDASRLDSEPYYVHFSLYPRWKGALAIYNGYRKRDKYLCFNCYGPYECTWRHHGYEASLMDLITEPEWMEEMLSRAADTIIETVDHCIKEGMKPDGIYMAEDLGEMRSTLFSPRIYKDLLWPQHKRIASFLHKNSISLLMHCDGKIDSLIPYFIESGIDVIQPLQANTGIDI
jgi:uroporphyrinogen decarboxylase